MAFTAATSQALVETTRQQLIAAQLAIESYIQVNNPGLLSPAVTALAAVTAAITAVSA